MNYEDPGHARTMYGTQGVQACTYGLWKKSKLCSYRSVHMYGHVRAYDYFFVFRM